MTTSYFKSERSTPASVLRRVDYVDEAFRGGQWKPTKEIVDWMAGHDDYVDDISEAEARRLAPAAFAAVSSRS